MATRSNAARKSAAKPEVVEEDVEVQPKFVDDHEEAVKASAFANFVAAQKHLFDTMGVPSGKRFLVGFITSLIVGAGIGFIGSVLVNLTVMSAISLGAGAFMCMIIQIIGMIATAVSVWFAGGAVSEYIVTEKVDQHIAIVRGTAVNAWNSITSLFSSKPAAA